MGPRPLTLPETVEELTRLGRNAESLHGKYSAHFQLHVSAGLDKDKERLSEHRRSLHVILDQILDNQEAIQRCQDQLAEYSRRMG